MKRTGTPAKSRKKNRVRVACLPCHQARTSCDRGEPLADGSRLPCSRCMRLDKAHCCVDRPPRKAIKVACLNCIKSKRSCDEQRPCSRCVAKGCGDQCCDRPVAKSRGGSEASTRKRTKRKSTASSSTSSSTKEQHNHSHNDTCSELSFSPTSSVTDAHSCDSHSVSNSVSSFPLGDLHLKHGPALVYDDLPSTLQLPSTSAPSAMKRVKLERNDSFESVSLSYPGLPSAGSSMLNSSTFLSGPLFPEMSSATNTNAHSFSQRRNSLESLPLSMFSSDMSGPLDLNAPVNSLPSMTYMHHKNKSTSNKVAPSSLYMPHSSPSSLKYDGAVNQMPPYLSGMSAINDDALVFHPASPEASHSVTSFGTLDSPSSGSGSGSSSPLTNPLDSPFGEVPTLFGDLDDQSLGGFGIFF